jgi:hypothetical protein
MAAEPASYGLGDNPDAVVGVIDKYQKKLRAKAHAAGEEVYAEKPRDFIRRIERECDRSQTPLVEPKHRP